MIFTTPPAGLRRLTLVLGAYGVASNAATAYLCSRLPGDPQHLAAHVAVYSCFAAILCVLGVMGARWSNANLVTIFANYLLIDVVICTIPRVLLLGIFPSVKHVVCSTDSVNAWIQRQGQAQSGTLRGDEMQAQCKRVVGVLQILLCLLAIGSTGVQTLLALRVSRFAHLLRQQSHDVQQVMLRAHDADQGRACLDEEKQ